MSNTSWTQSVEKARLATLKTFEGRMEAAAASFEQIPPNGKNAGDHTLSRFADEAGLAYQSLIDYRQVWEWLDRDSKYIFLIRSYSLALEAKRSGNWNTGQDFAVFLDGPTIDGFDRWTVDALRKYLGKGMTNTGKRQAENKAERVIDLLDDPEVVERVADDAATVRKLNRQQAKKHQPDEPIFKPLTSDDADHDRKVQDGAAEIVYRLADKAAGRWTPNERTDMMLHFLRRALDDAADIDVDALIEEIDVYLGAV